ATPSPHGSRQPIRRTSWQAIGRPGRFQHVETQLKLERVDWVGLEVSDRRSGDVVEDRLVAGRYNVDRRYVTAVQPVELQEDPLVLERGVEARRAVGERRQVR